ncbi:sensor histidine kinase [Clostridium oryzae]|uniref:histidine kinase n=1 Tax=Clostridium oryzae TaxID=1450648 RepID=A0A1V4IYJ9_9CLOT|nr:histidine kinase [Clostridium oryzae]OPJ65016.1 sensor histidine kinase YehU [Clostridium oryzae]
MAAILLFEKGKNTFNNMSLNRKLIFSYILIIMIPVLGVSFFVFNSLRHKYIEDAIKKNDYILGLEETKVVNNVNTMQTMVQKILASKQLVDYIQRKGRTPSQELIDININVVQDIENLQYSNPIIEDIKIYTSNPYPKEISPLIFREDRIDKFQWYKNVKNSKGNEYWDINFRVKRDFNNLVTKFKSGEDIVSINKKIYSYSKKDVGFLEIDMLSKNFFPTMYSRTDVQGSQIVAVDKDYKVHINRKSTLINKLQVTQKIIKNKIKNINNKKDGYLYLGNDRHIVMIYKYVPGIDCYILNIVSLDSVYKNIESTRNIVVMITLITILALIVVTNFINSLILKKLHIMIDTVSSIEKGNFDVKLNLYSDDELGQLAHQFRKLIRKIKELIEDEVNKKESTKEVELRALQTQIDSHFLYNTLENIKMIAEIEEQYLISDSITALGNMMKYNMKWNSEYVALKEEIAHIKNYIELMNLRYENKIKLRFDINEDINNCAILKLSLQPIIENSVKYAISYRIENGIDILIKARENEKNIYIDILDNGIGIDQINLFEINNELRNGKGGEELKTKEPTYSKKGNGLGLKNVNERMKLFYGQAYGIYIESEQNNFTKVTLNLPKIYVTGGSKNV